MERINNIIVTDRQCEIGIPALKPNIVQVELFGTFLCRRDRRDGSINTKEVNVWKLPGIEGRQDSRTAPEIQDHSCTADAVGDQRTHGCVVIIAFAIQRRKHTGSNRKIIKCDFSGYVASMARLALS